MGRNRPCVHNLHSAEVCNIGQVPCHSSWTSAGTAWAGTLPWQMSSLVHFLGWQPGDDFILFVPPGIMTFLGHQKFHCDGAYTWAGKGRNTATRQADFLLKWSFSLPQALGTVHHRPWGRGVSTSFSTVPQSLAQLTPGCTFCSISLQCLHTLGFTPVESIYQLRFCFHDWREFKFCCEHSKRHSERKKERVCSECETSAVLMRRHTLRTG